MLRRQSATALIASMRSSLAEVVALGAASVDTPTLVVVGENWEGARALGTELGAAFPRAWRERIDDSLAEPAIDAPAALAATLEEFLDRAEP
jgi:hypothetical protein